MNNETALAEITPAMLKEAGPTEGIQEMLFERRKRLYAIESEIEMLEAEKSAVEEEITMLEEMYEIAAFDE